MAWRDASNATEAISVDGRRLTIMMVVMTRSRDRRVSVRQNSYYTGRSHCIRSVIVVHARITAFSGSVNTLHLLSTINHF
jgi:hypothetical protein